MCEREKAIRDAITIEKIQTVLAGHQGWRPYAPALQVTIENAAVVIRGRVPTDSLRNQLTTAVRTAGVLQQIRNEVHCSS